MLIFVMTVWGCAAVFTGLGVYAMRRKKPMWFWSGSTVSEKEIADIPAYNRANGIMWLAYSLLYWASGVMSICNLGTGAIVLMLAAVAGGAGLVAAYGWIYKRYAREGG